MALDRFRELQGQIGAMNASRGFHGAAERPEEYRADYWNKKLFLIVNEAVEAQDQLREGHAIDEEYVSYPDSLVAEVGADPERLDALLRENGQLAKPEGVPSELADIIIRTMDLAEEAGIDLEKAIETKLAYNNTRGFRHGKAF